MDKILYCLVIALFTLLSWLPLRVHYFMSDLIYFLFYKVIRYRLSVVMTNVSRSFPDMDYKELDAVVRGFYHSLCDTIVETIWAFGHSRERVAKLLDFGGCDTLNEVYGEGRSVLVVMGHQCNWELYTSLPDLKSHYGLKMDNDHFYYVYKKMSGSVSDMVINRIRTKHNACVLVEKNQIVRHLLRNKDEGGVYYFIADQFPDKGAGLSMKFMNQPTRVFNGVEELARKLSLPVVFFSVDKVKRGLYRSEYVKICDDAAKTEKGFVTREYVRLLEESINNNKSNWLWSHRRWKKLK